jgi:hypothetical protein
MRERADKESRGNEIPKKDAPGGENDRAAESGRVLSGRQTGAQTGEPLAGKSRTKAGGGNIKQPRAAT